MLASFGRAFEGAQAMANLVTWKGICIVGAAVFGVGVICLAVGSTDTASTLFVVGIVEIGAAIVLLLIGSAKRKLAMRSKV
jgi:hypothetical protein